MSLKKRIYLLTPVLVLCCILSAGIYFNSPTVAEDTSSMTVNEIFAYEKGEYQPLTMEEVIEKSGNDQYEIVDFDVNLFDYNGDAWNDFSAYQFLDTGFFLFRHAGIVETTKYYNTTLGKTALNNVSYDNKGTIVNIFSNWGVNQNIRGIMKDTLVNGYPSFKTGVGNSGLGAGGGWKVDGEAIIGFREQMLFNTSNIEDFYGYSTHLFGDDGQIDKYWTSYKYQYDSDNDGLYDGIGDYDDDTSFNLDTIRTAYTGSFQFIHDKTTGYYTYDSSKNHAQFEATELDAEGNPCDVDKNGSINGDVVLYADTLGTTNFAADQSKLLSMYDSISTTDSVYDGTWDETYPYYVNSQYGGKRSDSGLGNSQLDAVGIKKESGIWTLVEDTSRYYRDDVTGVKKFHLWQNSNPDAFEYFAPMLKLYEFKIRTRNGSYDDLPHITEYPNELVDYIYIKFRVDESIKSKVGQNVDLRLQLIYENREKTEIDDLRIDTLPAEGAEWGKIITEKYTPGEWVELYIPTSEWGDVDIESLAIVPFCSDTNVNCKSTLTTYDESAYEDLYDPDNNFDNVIDFEIQAFSIVFKEDLVGYKIDEDSQALISPEDTTTQTEITITTGTVQHTNSNFLPFHKIENSYLGLGRENSYYNDVSSYNVVSGFEGELTQEQALEVLTNWDNTDTDPTYSSENTSGTTSRNQLANRSVSNIAYGQYSGGLGALGENDYGGTSSHFGMSMAVDFYLPYNMKTDNGDDIIFEFLGDDDMWVFIDDKLVLDIGGCHTALSGEINLTKGTVTYDKYNPDSTLYTLGEIDATTGATPKIEFNKTVNIYKEGEPVSQTNLGFESILKPGEHTLQIFYLERGSGVSNCYISFNLPQIPEGGINVSAEAAMTDESKIPADLNGDDIVDNDVIVEVSTETDKLGELVYKAPTGEEIENGLIEYEYTAKFKVLEAYDTYFKKTFSIYKTSDSKKVISGVKFTKLTPTQITADGTTYYEYTAIFSVPIGYTASILLPDDSIIYSVVQTIPSDDTDGVIVDLTYDKTNYAPSLKYVLTEEDLETEMTEYAETTVDNVSGTSVEDLDFEFDTGDDTTFKDYSKTSLVVGNDVNDVVALKLGYVNYYNNNVIEVEVNKVTNTSYSETDLDASNNPQNNLVVNDTASPKNDFEGKKFKFQISYKTASGEYETSSLAYYLVYSDGEKSNTLYTTQKGEFYIDSDSYAVISVPAQEDRSTNYTNVRIKELTYYDDLPGNYTHESTEYNVYVENIESKTGTGVEAEHSLDENCRFEFINNYVWNIDFDTNSDNKNVTMDVDENVKYDFYNEYDRENWSDGEGSAENTFDGTPNVVKNP